jgi:hypothetical protein
LSARERAPRTPLYLSPLERRCAPLNADAEVVERMVRST